MSPLIILFCVGCLLLGGGGGGGGQAKALSDKCLDGECPEIPKTLQCPGDSSLRSAKEGRGISVRQLIIDLVKPRDKRAAELLLSDEQELCSCNACEELPKCKGAEVPIVLSEGNGQPGSCCDRYVCGNKPQCDADAEPITYFQNKCTKCNSCMTLCEAICDLREPESCLSAGLVWAHGESWTESNGCVQCKCDNGDPQCLTSFGCPEPLEVIYPPKATASPAPTDTANKQSSSSSEISSVSIKNATEPSPPTKSTELPKFEGDISDAPPAIISYEDTSTATHESSSEISIVSNENTKSTELSKLDEDHSDAPPAVSSSEDTSTAAAELTERTKAANELVLATTDPNELKENHQPSTMYSYNATGTTTFVAETSSPTSAPAEPELEQDAVTNADIRFKELHSDDNENVTNPTEQPSDMDLNEVDTTTADAIEADNLESSSSSGSDLETERPVILSTSSPDESQPFESASWHYDLSVWSSNLVIPAIAVILLFLIFLVIIIVYCFGRKQMYSQVSGSDANSVNTNNSHYTTISVEEPPNLTESKKLLAEPKK